MSRIRLPMKATIPFAELIDETGRGAGEFPQLRLTALAQLALESGWGSSSLARSHYNYAGMKWREVMYRHALPVTYAAHDGKTKYCKFAGNRAFWAGYWHRLDAIDAYAGWRSRAENGDEFIRFIGPIWLGLSPEKNEEYVGTILRIRGDHFGEPARRQTAAVRPD